jgi:predicted NAD/FAD-binding protein
MRIAVIGAGVSGMVSAYLLCEEHQVILFEANDYLGGHTHTIEVQEAGRTHAVDTGFIVFNATTYPSFVRLLERLGVAWQPSVMSFSVRNERTGIEYSPSSLGSFFAQPRNALRPSFYRLALDLLRFRRESPALLETDDMEVTLGEYLEAGRYSRRFIDEFIVPMGAAIWSAEPASLRAMPVRFFARFFHNHAFLHAQQPHWLTIRGGSRTYVPPLTAPYREGIRLSCPVREIRRSPDGVMVAAAGGEPERFDAVVIATHSDQALALLADPTEAERQVLGALGYQENDVVLHTDIRLLPRRGRLWSAWNYVIPRQQQARVAVTYDMNVLQGLDTTREYCVTLNQVEAIDPSLVLERFVYHHPVFTPEAVLAQRRRDEISGVNRTYYCGAYWSNGFHEDGVRSALAVAAHFGKGL